MGFLLDLYNLTQPDLPKKHIYHNAQLSAGRHFTRSGASLRGTMSNWLSVIVNSRIAERQRRTISDRSWDLYVNDAMPHGLIEGLITEIVGTGLTPQAQPMLRWLNQTPEWAEEYQARNYDLFEIWGLDCRNWCDAQRRLNIYMLQALALFSWKLDGIGVFQVLNKPQPGSPLSLSILPIDPARLVTPSDLQSKKDVYDGVELDSDGAPVAAYILKNSNKQYSTSMSVRSDECTRVEVFDSATGLPRLLLVCDVRNIAEYRQDSILSPMIKEIRDNADLTDAAIVKTLINNLIALFIEDTLATDRSKLPIEDRIQQIDVGTIIYGAAGEKPHSITNDSPGTGYKDINESIVGRLGMATCRGPENIAKSYKASYSASQASIENAGKFDDTDRAVLVNQFCQPIECWKQYEAAARGLIQVKSMAHFLGNLHAYTRTVWFPPKLRPIDKLKAANARDVDLQNGSTTYSDIYGERSMDWRAAMRQRAIEIAYNIQLEKEYGLPEGVLSLKKEVTQPSIEPKQPSQDDEE